MSQPKTTRIPAPLYAAAGAGEMAYRQLLKLPTYANDLSDKAANNGAEIRQSVITTTTGLRERAAAAYRQANERAVKLRREDLDMDRLRDLAMRNAGQFIVTAQEIQERAISSRAARRSWAPGSWRPPTSCRPTWSRPASRSRRRPRATGTAT